ncbi:Aldehyde/histidinol dehydrogenase [Naematelia encephala]|uniref:Aldehyde/histidinol dehydrogenase n=1 Tax=Naematelia encephala TaxID=71784 RepID=A0A1Y2APP5_9TREE|nr:Aldehyde/histidinol dehydrogenase [Naematelia encephala]
MRIRYEASTLTDIQQAITSCQGALQSWAQTPVNDRCEILLRAARLLEDQSTGWSMRLRDANRYETDISDFWSQAQIDEAPGSIKSLVGFAGRALEPEIVRLPEATVHITREPFGICLAMPAWNAVHALTMRSIITPLLAGNTVLLKTSETTPYTQYLWATLLHEAGVPKAALNVIHIAPKDAPVLVEALISDKRIRHVNFTGSTRVGSIIASLAGRYLKPTLMELGGKAPVIILPDADLEIAASHIIFGAFMNAGQLCMSTERIIVQASQYDALVDAFRAAWKGLGRGRTRALYSKTSADRINGLLDAALAQGAISLLDDSENALTTKTTASSQSGPGTVIPPTLLGRVTREMKIFREETFAPVAVVIVVADKGRREEELITEMVDLANDSDYGLTAAVWGRDVKQALAVAERIEAGAVHLNKPTNADPPNVPHGGWKSSGWGRFNGVEGLRSFTQSRSIEIPYHDSHPMPLHMFGL